MKIWYFHGQYKASGLRTNKIYFDMVLNTPLSLCKILKSINNWIINEWIIAKMLKKTVHFFNVDLVEDIPIGISQGIRISSSHMYYLIVTLKNFAKF